MKRLLVGLAAACALALPAPAAAETPRNVHDGRSGVVDAGWVRVLCATSDDGVKCALRVPDGFTRLDLDYRARGQRFAHQTARTENVRHTDGPRRTMERRVVRGVRIACEARGNQLDCALDFAPRLTRFNVSMFSSGDHRGGMAGVRA